MKKLVVLAFVAMSLYSCSKDEASGVEDQSVTMVNGRKCASQDVLDKNLENDPTLRAKMEEIEAFTARLGSNFDISNAKLVNGKIQIPVVVNVLYRTTAENISDAQIQSQIDVLNKDFNATNSEYASVPAAFSGVKTNVGISFVLDQVIRKSTTKTSWGTADAMKKVASGGIAATTPTTKMNLWICTIGGGILGYAQFPGGASATDGVVCDSKYVGTTGTATYPYNLGRTATHEVGHWLNLRHIWGDASCGSDLVADTPTHNTSNYGAPAYPHYSTCTGTPIEMTMNYMDYTDDRAMSMFTAGQKTRMMAIFATGGSRAAFAQ